METYDFYYGTQVVEFERPKIPEIIAKKGIDGENIASEKEYPRLASYKPVAGDRVILAKLAGTYVILGKVI